MWISSFRHHIDYSLDRVFPKNEMPSKFYYSSNIIEHMSRTIDAKGQLILKCSFGVTISTKTTTNFFKDFCPSFLKEVKSKK